MKNQIKKLAKIPSHIWYGIKIGVWAMIHHDIFGSEIFKMLNELLRLILKVATEDKPHMTEIIVTVEREVVQPVVHIWAGNGYYADVYKRIEELSKENTALKELFKWGEK